MGRGLKTGALRNLFNLAAMAIGVFACARPPLAPGAGEFVEGSRLRAVFQQADGAPPLLLNWFDTEIGVDCDFRDVGLLDGSTVCLPRSAYAIDQPTLFTDSDCKNPVVSLDVSCEKQPRFFTQTPRKGDSCGTTSHVFSVGPALMGMPVALFASSVAGSSCQPMTSTIASVQSLHPLGPEIPLDTLVRGTYKPVAGPGRIVPLSIVASDGTVQVAGTANSGQAWDNEREEVVFAWDAASNFDGRWAPSTGYEQGLFSDAACTIPVLVGPACPAPAKEFSLPSAADACGNANLAGAEQIGAPAPTGDVYYRNPLSPVACQPTLGTSSSPITNPMDAAFVPGPQVPATAFAEVTEVLTGSQQLQLIRTGSADGPPTYPRGFFDRSRGSPCRAGVPLAADGSVRCLPSATEMPPFFADDACSVPILVGTSPSACSSKPAFASRTGTGSMPSNSCSTLAVQHIFPVGDRYAGSVFSPVSPGTCASVGSTDAIDEAAYQAAGASYFVPSPSLAVFFSVGSEIPASELPPVKIVRPN